jgi:hypothetical protein
MNFIDKYHLIRRTLLAVFAYFFLKITYNIFFNGITLDTYKLSAYLFFGSIIMFMVKWYHNSRDKEGKIK